LGTRVIERLSADLRAEFPEMKGLSRGNLGYMRRLATAWADREDCLRVVGKLPWGHIQTLLDKLDKPVEREWYAQAAIEHGWSRAVLLNQIMGQLHHRAGAAPSNFADTLPAGDSELMQQLTKDPYSLDFLTLAAPVAERDLERALVAHIERFLLELGTGFAFVGRQRRLQLDADEFFIDLLMFNTDQNRFRCTTDIPTHDRYARSRGKLPTIGEFGARSTTRRPTESRGTRPVSSGSSGSLILTPDASAPSRPPALAAWCSRKQAGGATSKVAVLGSQPRITGRVLLSIYPSRERRLCPVPALRDRRNYRAAANATDPGLRDVAGEGWDPRSLDG
jgi:predicted nuclease of restriction endonuclease-like (RecB) superfamily